MLATGPSMLRRAAGSGPCPGPAFCPLGGKEAGPGGGSAGQEVQELGCPANSGARGGYLEKGGGAGGVAPQKAG